MAKSRIPSGFTVKEVAKKITQAKKEGYLIGSRALKLEDDPLNPLIHTISNRIENAKLGGGLSLCLLGIVGQASAFKSEAEMALEAGWDGFSAESYKDRAFLYNHGVKLRERFLGKVVEKGKKEG